MNNLISESNREIAIFTDKDLPGYIEYLRRLEKAINKNKAFDPSLQREINEKTLQIVAKGDSAIMATDKKTAEKIKSDFRQAILPWMGQSVIMKRGFEKPRGYAGDYQSLEYLYDNKPVSSGIGHYFDNGFLQSELASAVRNRKDLMASLLLKTVSLSKKSEIKILNIASGSCREIFDIQNKVPSKVKFTCVDFDDEALAFSSNKLSRLNINFTKEDILSMIKNKDSVLPSGNDLIYSIGLVDYLPDKILERIVKQLYEKLSPSGEMILSFKDRSRYDPIREDWLTDWKFIPRDFGAVKWLADILNIPENKIITQWEPSHIIFFASIPKLSCL